METQRQALVEAVGYVSEDGTPASKLYGGLLEILENPDTAAKYLADFWAERGIKAELSVQPKVSTSAPTTPSPADLPMETTPSAVPSQNAMQVAQPDTISVTAGQQQAPVYSPEVQAAMTRAGTASPVVPTAGGAPQSITMGTIAQKYATARTPADVVAIDEALAYVPMSEWRNIAAQMYQL
jgi:hypothetical protein